MVKKTAAVVVDETTASTLPAEILTPEVGDQGSAPEGTQPNAPETTAPAEDAHGAFIDDAGDASADDPLPGPTPTPEQSGAAAPGVALWRKKPVVVEAILYTGNNLAEVFAFTGKHPKWDEWFASWGDYEAHVRKDGWAFRILTLAGTMEALPGDWIIRGIAGEHYPCKPEIFGEIYEAASNPVIPQVLGHNDMVEAFMAGAFGVHEEWLRAHAAGEAPPRGDPEFREAATNHADGYAARYIAHVSRDQPLALEQAVQKDRSLCAEERLTDTMLSPDTAEQAIDWLNRLGCVDPEAAARISWPGLFPPAADDEPEPVLSEALLRATLAEIEARNSDLSRPGLIEELKAIDGVSIEDVPGGISLISLHGVTASAAGGMPSVLRVWCQKARRAIMNGRAV